MAYYATDIINGNKHIITVYRGTEYMLMRAGDAWGVVTRRLALGRFNTGGYKQFNTLAEVKANCKAFAAVELTDVL